MNLLKAKKHLNSSKSKFTLLVFLLSISIIPSCSDHDILSIKLAKYPNGKDFAFTIIDDPDYGTFEERYIMFGLLDELGFKTTTCVWVLDNKHGSGMNAGKSNTRGITTTDESYLTFLYDLQNKAFEICFHTVSPGNDLREETQNGYELFKEQFGHYPKINTNHATNLEDIYWGKDRFSNPIMRYLYGIIANPFYGHTKTSQYFWGDICQEKTKYVRGWATDKINTLSTNKTMPYHLDEKPYVNWWFGCSDGYNCNKFIRLLSDANIKKLIAERGTCIAYTHFAYGFIAKDSKVVNEDVKKQLSKLSQLDGWFVPVSNILDRFLLLRNVELINDHNSVLIINHNHETVNGLTVLTNQNRVYLFNRSEWIYPNKDGEIILGNLPPYSALKLGRSEKLPKNYSPGIGERITIVWDWFAGRFNK